MLTYTRLSLRAGGQGFTSLGPGSLVGNRAKKIGKRSEPTGYWRLGDGAMEPGDMPLMLPFHNTRFWYHALVKSVNVDIFGVNVDTSLSRVAVEIFF